MKTLKYLTPIASLFLLIGCNKPNNDLLSDGGPSSENETTVVQERNPDYPFSDDSKFVSLSPETRAAFTLEDCVGRSFMFNHFPIENMQNVGSPVLDIKSFADKYPDYYDIFSSAETEKTQVSYAGFARFDQTTEYSEVIAGSIKLNIFEFKAGYEQTFKREFKLSTTQMSNYIFGEGSIYYAHKCYRLLTSANVINILARDYVKKSFTDNLYHSSIRNTYTNYGGHVLARFLSGGRAVSIYRGIHKENSTSVSEKKEQDFNALISASFLNVGGETSLKVGNVDSKLESEMEKFDSVFFCVKTYGGSLPNSQFTIAKDISSTVYNLSDWCQSINNGINHTIAKIIERGLIPLSELVEEYNIKNAFNKYTMMGAASNLPATLVAPRIEVYLFRNPLTQQHNWETRLRTRYGEYVTMKRETMASMTLSQRNVYFNQEIARVKSLFPYIEIVKIESTTNARAVGGGGVTHIPDPYNFDFRYMSKFVDAKTGKTYLIPTKQLNGVKTAYTLYDQSVINAYIFQYHINNLPEWSGSVDQIRATYRLIAL